jgi:hypothetical protein
VYLLITYYLLLITPKPSSKDRALDPIMKVSLEWGIMAVANI